MNALKLSDYCIEKEIIISQINELIDKINNFSLFWTVHFKLNLTVHHENFIVLFYVFKIKKLYHIY